MMLQYGQVRFEYGQVMFEYGQVMFAYGRFRCLVLEKDSFPYISTTLCRCRREGCSDTIIMKL